MAAARASPELEDLSVAVAHWHVRSWGGAEYLVTRLAEALGRDRVYTMGPPDPESPNPFGDVTFYDLLDGRSLTRRLQRRAGRLFEYALWEDVDWREYGDFDVLVTSGSTTRAIITPDDILHVNYCHSPSRWFYDLYHDRKSSLTGRVARPVLRHLRTRDAAIDPRVDHYVANSPIVERRLWKYYKRDATVVYPPVDVDRYQNGGDDGYYLHLGRLDEEKGVPAIVEAFEGLDSRLVFAGWMGYLDRTYRDRIEGADNIEYRGFVSEAEKRELLSRCRAVVFNGRNEDFGIVPIEANASGKACLVPDDGFPGLFVRDGVNGYHHDGTAGGVRQAIDRFQEGGIEDPADAVAKFGTDHFEASLRNFLSEAYDSFRLPRTIE